MKRRCFCLLPERGCVGLAVCLHTRKSGRPRLQRQSPGGVRAVPVPNRANKEAGAACEFAVALR